jgi:hypothetical protein
MPVASPFRNPSNTGVVNLITEDLTSQCNGERQSFTVSSPYTSGKLQVYWNGLLQTSTEITETTQTQFTTDFTAQSDDNLVVIYVKK